MKKNTNILINYFDFNNRYQERNSWNVKQIELERLCYSILFLFQYSIYHFSLGKTCWFLVYTSTANSHEFIVKLMLLQRSPQFIDFIGTVVHSRVHMNTCVNLYMSLRITYNIINKIKDFDISQVIQIHRADFPVSGARIIPSSLEVMSVRLRVTYFCQLRGLQQHEIKYFAQEHKIIPCYSN